MSKRGPGSETSVVTSIVTVIVVGLILFTAWQLRSSATPAIDARELFTSVTTADVNLREGPGEQFAVLDVIAEGTEVKVTGASRHGFEPVEATGAHGWMSTSWLAPISSTARQHTPSSLSHSNEASTAVSATTIEPTVPPSEFPTLASTSPPTVLPTVVPTESVSVSTPIQAAVADTVDAEPMVSHGTEPVEGELPEQVVPGERWIEVDRSEATVTLHDGNRIVAVFAGLMGRDPSPDGYYSTAIGTYHVFSMNRDLTETPFAPGVFLTDWVGFDPERSNGFHSPTRDAEGNVVQTGGTVTMGCVRLSEDDARFLFDFAELGMRVEIHD